MLSARNCPCITTTNSNDSISERRIQTEIRWSISGSNLYCANLLIFIFFAPPQTFCIKVWILTFAPPAKEVVYCRPFAGDSQKKIWTKSMSVFFSKSPHRGRLVSAKTGSNPISGTIPVNYNRLFRKSTCRAVAGEALTWQVWGSKLKPKVQNHYVKF